MPSVLFRGNRLLSFHCLPKEGVRLCRAKFEADYTTKLCEEIGLGWQPLPATSDEMEPSGVLLGCKDFVLTPGDGMAKNGVTVACISAQKFEVVRVREKGKDSTNDVIRFEVLCSSDTCVELLDGYMNTVGDVKGTMKLTYSKSKGEDHDAGKSDQQTLIEMPAPAKGKGEKPKDPKPIKGSVQ